MQILMPHSQNCKLQRIDKPKEKTIPKVLSNRVQTSRSAGSVSKHFKSLDHYWHTKKSQASDIHLYTTKQHNFFYASEVRRIQLCCGNAPPSLFLMLTKLSYKHERFWNSLLLTTTLHPQTELMYVLPLRPPPPPNNATSTLRDQCSPQYYATCRRYQLINELANIHLNSNHLQQLYSTQQDPIDRDKIEVTTL